jgi:hypothetical protein
MKGLKTAGVVAGVVALLGGRRRGVESGDLRRKGYERALAVVTGTALMLSLMVLVASPALAHHPILDVTAECDDVGNKVVTWSLANGNWEGRTMTVSQVQYTDGVVGWSNIVVGQSLAPDASTSESVVYPLTETGTKTITVSTGWSDGGPQGVSASLSTNLVELVCDDSTSTTVGDTTPTTEQETTTTTEAATTTTATPETTAPNGQVDSTNVVAPPDDSNVGGETTSTVEDSVQGTEITTTTVGDEVEDLEVLPFTGSDDVALITLAVSAIALGAVLVVSARREES